MPVRCLLALMIISAGPALTQRTTAPTALDQASHGVALAGEQRYPEAIEAYKQAIRLNPALPGIHINLGLAYFKSGRFSEAIAAFQVALSRQPESVQARTLLGMSYFGARNYLEAAKQLEITARSQPDNAELLHTLAESYLRSGDYRRALEAFQKLLQLDSGSGAAHMMLAQALDAVGREAEATAEMEQAVRAGPREPNVRFSLGYLYWKQLRYEDAAKEFRLELQNDPHNSFAAAYLGDIERRQEHFETAEKLLLDAVRDSQSIRVAWFNLALVQERNGLLEKASASLRKAIALDPKRADAYYRLAAIYRKLGRRPEADAQLSIVKSLHQEKNEDLLLKISGPTQK